MKAETRPLHADIKKCLDELARAHCPVAEWVEAGLQWLERGEVSSRELARADRNCTRHLASLQDVKDVLHLMEARYQGCAASFVQARADADALVQRLQTFLHCIRAQKVLVPDRPLYVVHVALVELPEVVNAYTAIVEEQERAFTFFGMAPEFMDSALLNAELDALEDDCEEYEGLAEALETKVALWRCEATPEQARMLHVCGSLVQRLRFVQRSKRQTVAKLRDATADAIVAAKLKKLVEETDVSGLLAPMLH